MSKRFYKVLTLSILVFLFLTFSWPSIIKFVYIMSSISTPLSMASIGQLGDSFSPPASFFTLIALVFSIYTNYLQFRQLNQIKEDRSLKYRKQLYDLFFSDAKISKCYHYVKRGMISFFSQEMERGGTNYLIIREIEMDGVELESSVDALLGSVDLAIRYIDAKLIEEEGIFMEKINTILRNNNISCYVKTLKLMNDRGITSYFSYPNLYKYIIANSL